jgi:hypothetical protein
MPRPYGPAGFRVGQTLIRWIRDPGPPHLNPLPLGEEVKPLSRS